MRPDGTGRPGLLLGLALALLGAGPLAAAGPREAVAGGFAAPGQRGACLTAEQRGRIERRLARNLERLDRRGKLPKATGTALLDWPLATASGGPSHHVVTGFVDHDPATPGFLRDYSCGERTYDLESGYNHAGTDYVTWPFAWYRMERDEELVVAAAPGVIVDRQDGYPDRSCTLSGLPWNAVYVRHDDGSIAWYGHLKRGSVIGKGVGERVARGEVLGVVGSSGSSTIPHLHLELYDPAGGRTDPYEGPCNNTFADPTWIEQRPYHDPAITRLATHDAVPELPPCPEVERPHLRDVFLRGERVLVGAYYRDVINEEPTLVAVRRPDGTLADAWSHRPDGARGVAGAWLWETWIPLAAPLGTWTVEAEFGSAIYRHSFEVVEGLALLDGRFEVAVAWENQFDGSRGAGRPVPASDLAGYFTFTDPRNHELVVKMLDFGDRVLLFYGQLTNLRFRLVVRDQATGAVRGYENGPSDCGGFDPDAFPGLGSGTASLAGLSGAVLGSTPTAASSRGGRASTGAATLSPSAIDAALARQGGPCVPADDRLCLLGGRVAVEVAWRNQLDGSSGTGRAAPLSALAGQWSFTDPRNVEVVTKALDFGDRILFLWGSLSTLEYEITVTDTVSGETHSYQNPAGRYCGGLDPDL